MIELKDFQNSINEENMTEMKKLEMPVQWAYKELLSILEEEKIESYDVNLMVKRIINEYLDELLYRENRKYDIDWE